MYKQYMLCPGKAMMNASTRTYLGGNVCQQINWYGLCHLGFMCVDSARVDNPLEYSVCLNDTAGECVADQLNVGYHSRKLFRVEANYSSRLTCVVKEGMSLRSGASKSVGTVGDPNQRETVYWAMFYLD